MSYIALVNLCNNQEKKKTMSSPPFRLWWNRCGICIDRERLHVGSKALSERRTYLMCSPPTTPRVGHFVCTGLVRSISLRLVRPRDGNPGMEIPLPLPQRLSRPTRRENQLPKFNQLASSTHFSPGNRPLSFSSLSPSFLPSFSISSHPRSGEAGEARSGSRMHP